MMKKLLTALYVSLLISGFYLIAGAMVQEVMMFAVIVFVYTAIGTIIYGIPVSYLSDWLTKNMQDYRLLAAGLIHLFSGAATVLFLDELALYAVFSASLFFVINEWLHRKERSRKKLLGSSLAIAAFLALAIFTAYKVPPLFVDKTNTIYLIPEGFEGPILVFYSEPNQPKLVKEGAFKVVPVEVAKLKEEQDTYGFYETATPQSHGILNNQFYYVNQAGERTTIPYDCVSYVGSGSFSGSNGRTAKYEMLQMTKSMCGENFFMQGNERYRQLSEKVLEEMFER
jgi:MFS family permease